MLFSKQLGYVPHYLELAQTISPFFGGMNEGTLPELVPSLLEPPLAVLFTKILSPDSFQASKTMLGLIVSINANHYHRWTLEDGNRLTYFILSPGARRHL